MAVRRRFWGVSGALAFGCCCLLGQTTTTTLSLSASSGSLSQPLTLTALVSPTPAGGQVTFYDGAAVLETKPLTGGQASLTTTLLGAGAHLLRAYYTGAGSYTASTSVTLPYRVSSLPADTLQPAGVYGNPDSYVIATGDFNGDGKVDLAVAGRSSSELFVLLGNGGGTFQAPVAYPVGPNPLAIVVADFNGDGKADLAVGSQAGAVDILLGNGDGTFQPAVSSGSYSSGFLVAADFNGDGNVDLATTSVPSGIGIMLGNGDGTFQPLSHIASPLPSGLAVVADFNGDGKADLAIAQGNDYFVTVFLGNGDGTFQGPVNYQTSYTADYLAVADFNGDGKLDMAISGNGSISILLGKGDGTFQSSADIPAAASETNFMGAGDFNGDGKADLIVYNSGSNTLDIHYGNGDGTFQPPVPFSAGNTSSIPTALALGDFNQDGKTDLAYAGAAGAASILLAIEIQATSVAMASSANPSAYGQTVTFTATASQVTATGTVTFYDGLNEIGSETLTNGQASLSTNRLAIGAHSIHAFYGGDANNAPGYGAVFTETVISTLTASTIALASSANPSSYGQSVTLTATVTPAAASGVVTFYDGTTILETEPLLNGQATLRTSLLGSGVRSLYALYTGNVSYAASKSAVLTQSMTALPSYSFLTPVNYIGSNMAFSVADLNGDGKADFAIANVVSSFSSLLGNGDGAFHTGASYIVSGFPVAVADLNGDGKADLIFVSNAGNTMSVLLGNGDGTFQPALSTATGAGPSSAAVGDFNGDGKLDVAVANSTPIGRNDLNGTVSVFLGNGDGTFQAPVNYVTALDPKSVAVGDFNGDGKPDLVTANAEAKNASVLLGNGDGTFQPAVNYPADSSADSVVVSDINADGKQDLVIANQYGGANGQGTISILLGNGDGTFQSAVAYPVCCYLDSVAVGDFNGDGRPDLAVSSFQGLSILIGTQLVAGTTTLTSTPDPSVSGQAVTLTATVPGRATGAVTFYDGTTVLGAVGVTGGQAVLTISSLTEGVHSLTAVYSGDSTFQPGSSAVVGQAVNGIPLLTITCSHAGVFTQGETGATYIITVSNAANGAPTSGTVTVKESLPSGLEISSSPGPVLTGTGWSCSGNTCTRGDALNPGAAYPAITVTFNVATNAPASVINSVTVSGGGSSSATATDPTTVSAEGVHSPTVISLSPASSSGATQFYTMQFADTFGSADLTVLDVLINSALDGRHACYLAYVQQSNTVYLVDDAGDAGGPFAGGLVLNGSGSISNSQCTVNGVGASAVGSGNVVTLTLNLSFASAFAGNKVVYLAARDTAQNSSGWQAIGVHAVPPLTATYPNPVAMSPASGSTANALLSFTFQDASAADNLETAWALINTAVDGRSACYVAYYRPGNQVYLYPDNGDGTAATSMVLTGTNTVGNSQCTVSAQGSSVVMNGAQMTVNLNVSFSPAFAGPKGVWMAVQTSSGVSIWQALGEWFVP